MVHVFLLQHSYEIDGCDETKVIGVYPSRGRGEQAIARLRALPGFRDRPDEFHIDDYLLDQDHWVEGYVAAR